MNELLLLSGGIDSACLAYQLKPACALVIDYGQGPANGEIRAARSIAKATSIPLEVVHVDCRAVGSGLLAGRDPIALAPSAEWWPFRNQLLVTVAAAQALNRGCSRILLGCVSTDSFHADGRAEFVKLLDALTSSQEGGIHVEAPAVQMTSVELVRESNTPESILGWTHSCHRAEYACGRCPGCLKREQVLAKTGLLR